MVEIGSRRTAEVPYLKWHFRSIRRVCERPSIRGFELGVSAKHVHGQGAVERRWYSGAELATEEIELSPLDMPRVYTAPIGLLNQPQTAISH